jgi:hypothetical protein
LKSDINGFWVQCVGESRRGLTAGIRLISVAFLVTVLIDLLVRVTSYVVMKNFMMEKLCIAAIFMKPWTGCGEDDGV